MKAYAIVPPFEMYAEDVPDEKTQASISLIARIAFNCLRRGGDTFQFAIDWRDPGAPPGSVGFHDDIAEPHIVRLESADDLLSRIRASVDPNGRGSGDVRSIMTCRAITFGFDGQAFLCLRHEDDAPVSPDEALAVVMEQPELLSDTDYFDGWVRPQM